MTTSEPVRGNADVDRRPLWRHIHGWTGSALRASISPAKATRGTVWPRGLKTLSRTPKRSGSTLNRRGRDSPARDVETTVLDTLHNGKETLPSATALSRRHHAAIYDLTAQGGGGPPQEPRTPVPRR